MLDTRPELANMAMSYGDEHRPIHFAVMHRSPEMVRLLMQYGASAREGIDPHRPATTVWMLAKDRGYDEIVALIEDEERRQMPPAGEPQQPEEVRGDEEARTAVAQGNIGWLRARHAAGTLTNSIRWRGGGLLTVAVEHNRPDILTLLLDYGFDPQRACFGRRRRLGRILARLSAVDLRRARQARDRRNPARPWRRPERPCRFQRLGRLQRL